MRTLPDRVADAVARGHALTLVDGDDHDHVPWSEVHADARAMAAALQGRGIGPGDHVGLLSPTNRELVTAIQATWLAGAVTVVLPLPMRLGSIEELVAATRRRIDHAEVGLVVAAADLAAFVDPEPGDPPMIGFDDLAGGDPAHFEPPPPDPERVLLCQFTSGSTADPKGVVLRDRHVAANLDAIAEATHLDPDDDVLVSWLPLYHDMGLVGLLCLAMTTGTPLVLAGPQDFTARPSRWMEWISAYGGTATAGPNFSYVLAARALRRAAGNGEGLDLSRLRIALNGAEPIDPAAVEAFVAAGAPFGLAPEAIFPAFGMAEVAIAGTFPEPGTGLRVDAVDLAVVEAERYAATAEPDGPRTRCFPKLGRAVPGLEVRICDPGDGRVLAERGVGEVEIRGTSVTEGYHRRPDLNEKLFHDGWLRTGDLGYRVDGELVLCGRIKDVIIVGGRNVFPEDVERSVDDLTGVRAGNVIAFGVDTNRGREGLVVVAETRAGDVEPVKRSVSERVRAAVGLPPTEIVLVQPGTLPKTSSGKLQRSACRDQYLKACLQPV